MSVTVDDLARFVGSDADALSDDGDQEAEGARDATAFSSAEIEIDMVLERAYREVPDDVRDRLVLEVGHAYFKRADSPSGSSQGVDFSTGAPVLGPRDPLAQVWPIIRRYVTPF